MDAIVSVVVIVAFVLAAAFVGHAYRERRDGRRGPAHALALAGATGRDLSPTRMNAAGAGRPQGPAIGRYPTLARIDRARGDDGRRFATCGDAARLERIARALVDEYWSETAWLTGIVHPAAFGRVCAALDRERLAIERSLVRDSLPAA